MDLQEYLDQNIIGPGNQQADCNGLNLMVETARNTRDAMLKAVTELFFNSTAYVRQENSGKWSTIVNRLNSWNQRKDNLYFYHEILFNSLLCPGNPEKKTVDEVMLTYPFSAANPQINEPFNGFNSRSLITQPENGPTISYASFQTYEPGLLNLYKDAHEEFLCDTKKVIAFLLDQRPGEGAIAPDVPVNGYCPPYDPGV